MTRKSLGWNTRFLLDTFPFGSKRSSEEGILQGPFTLEFLLCHWPLCLAGVIHWERACISIFLLHRKQHLPATIRAEKRRHATGCSLICFIEDAAFCRHIISPRSFSMRMQASQHASLFRRITESRRIMYKSGGFSVLFSISCFLNLHLNSQGSAQKSSMDYLTAGAGLVLRHKYTKFRISVN
jgi:hypothetical protein